MPELRIILLVAGVLFSPGWRGSNGGGNAARGRWPARSRDDSQGDHAPARAAPLPDLNVVRDARVAVSDSLPVIELASTRHRHAPALGISISDEVASTFAQSTPHIPERQVVTTYIGDAPGAAASSAASTAGSARARHLGVRVFDEHRCSGPSSCWPGRARPSAASSRCA
jgi:hypothetical protein